MTLGGPPAYDLDGNVTADGSNTYGWDEFAKLKWTATSGTPTCGSTGECITYDAFGRMVENSSGGAYTEMWITQLGTIVQMAGTTPNYGYFPAPEGGTAIINGNRASYGYLHKDWLGSARIVSSITSHGATVDQAFSPYGEIYDQFGSTSSPYDMFAQITQNFAPGVVWDTPNRELSVVGRWLNPDPALQGWNQYAYPTNPTSFIDSSGLVCSGAINDHLDTICTLSNYGGGGGSGSWGGYDTFQLMNVPVVGGSEFGQIWNATFNGAGPIAPDVAVFDDEGNISYVSDISESWGVWNFNVQGWFNPRFGALGLGAMSFQYQSFFAFVPPPPQLVSSPCPNCHKNNGSAVPYLGVRPSDPCADAKDLLEAGDNVEDMGAIAGGVGLFFGPEGAIPGVVITAEGAIMKQDAKAQLRKCK